MQVILLILKIAIKERQQIHHYVQICIKYRIGIYNYTYIIINVTTGDSVLDTPLYIIIRTRMTRSWINLAGVS